MSGNESVKPIIHKIMPITCTGVTLETLLDDDLSFQGDLCEISSTPRDAYGVLASDCMER